MIIISHPAILPHYLRCARSNEVQNECRKRTGHCVRIGLVKANITPITRFVCILITGNLLNESDQCLTFELLLLQRTLDLARSSRANVLPQAVNVSVTGEMMADGENIHLIIFHLVICTTKID